jgi:hypothetical protein
VAALPYDVDALGAEVVDRTLHSHPAVVEADGFRGSTVYGGGEGGRGVWLAHQLCDLVQLRTAPSGTAVRTFSWV